jgi:hypothetical protein
MIVSIQAFQTGVMVEFQIIPMYAANTDDNPTGSYRQ